MAEGDGLPELICEQCVKQLIVAFNFKKQSEQIDATLREITKNPNIEYIKVEQAPIEEILEAKLDDTKGDDMRLFEITLANNEENSVEEYIEDLNEETKDCNNSEELEDNIKTEFVLIEQNSNDEIYFEENEDFACDVCLKTFKTYDAIFKHKKLHANKKFECSKCNISFQTKIELVKHRKPHKNMKYHKCDLCGREFRSPHGLAYHKKTYHSGIKNYACTYENCKKAFALKQALDKHLSVHAKDGNHLCYLCGKMYSTYDALHYHIRTHDGVRPHLCVHCGKTFKQSCHLKAHMWVHNGVKPHECKTCGKCYTSGHQLKKHLKKYCNNFEIDTI